MAACLSVPNSRTDWNKTNYTICMEFAGFFNSLLMALLGVGEKLIERLWPDPAKAAEAKLELFKLEQSGELQQIVGQLEINKAEATNASVFVSGWRPFIGWVCGMALVYQYIIRPIVSWWVIAAGHQIPEMPGLDDNLWELLLGMLGLGGLRTVRRRLPGCPHPEAPHRRHGRVDRQRHPAQG